MEHVEIDEKGIKEMFDYLNRMAKDSKKTSHLTIFWFIDNKAKGIFPLITVKGSKADIHKIIVDSFRELECTQQHYSLKEMSKGYKFYLRKFTS